MTIKEYTYHHLSVVRVIFGLYLFVHFSYLIPFASEMFSADGMFPASMSLTYPFFPNVFNLEFLDNGYFATLFCFCLSVLSLLVVAGNQYRLVYLLLWFGWATLLCRNPLIRNPGMPYVGWMMLAFACIGPIRDRSKFEFPKVLFYGAWALLAIGYTLSGVDKLNSPSWQDGTAITHLLNNPLSRTNFLADAIREMSFLHAPVTYFALAMEILFLPLAFFKATRPWIWLGLVGMQVGILFQVDFADLTFGMLMIHLFVFDPRWIRPKKLSKPITVYFDGVCGLCNRIVDFLVREDHLKNIRYAPIQGEAASLALSAAQRERLDTFYVLIDGKLLEKSQAYIHLSRVLGGFWRFVWYLRWIPSAPLDRVYDFIAKRRYMFFGKKEICRIPSKEERELFFN